MLINHLKVFSLLILLLIQGCASSNALLSTSEQPESLPHAWMNKVTKYSDRLGPGHPDRLPGFFKVSNEMRTEVERRFGHFQKHAAAEYLAKWLVDEDGHNMQYDIDANFSPTKAFKERRANCLSFTILLNSLAAELGIEMKYNEVDIPDIWGVEGNSEMVLYRHVNSLYENITEVSVYDLAIEEFDFGYPQRLVKKEAAAAKLHSNLAIQHRKQQRIDASLHHIYLAISTTPKEADLWVNLGVIYKNDNRLNRAEQAFKYALKLDKTNRLAASNLHRLFKQQERHQAALKYQSLAKKSRRQNPYVHFQQANRHYIKNELKLAKASIRRAQQLHDQDPRFFILSSKIAQRQSHYTSAIKDLKKAHELSKNSENKQRFAYKIRMVSKLRQDRDEKRRKLRNNRELINPYGG